MKPRLFLIDGNSYMYRAFYAIPSLTTSKGFPTNAILGFFNMLQKIIKEHKPDLMAVIFDAKGPTFRHDRYEHYKSTRRAIPDELLIQIPVIKEIIDTLHIYRVELPGYEADDVIGTITKKAVEDGLFVIIMTSDKDMFQLISGDVSLYDTLKDQIYGVSEVYKRFGTSPDKVADVLGLAGDSSDNIPGVRGIGDKIASSLIQRFGSLEGVIENIDEIQGDKRRETLKECIDVAFLSRDLATIDTSVPLSFFPLKDFVIKESDFERLEEIFRDLEFHKLLRDFIPPKEDKKRCYRIVDKEDCLKRIIDEIRKVGKFAFSLETTSPVALCAHIVGLSLCYNEHEAFYIPIMYDYPEVPIQIEREVVMKFLKSLMEDESLMKIGHNLKYSYAVLLRNDIILSPPLFDAMVASHLLNSTRANNNLESISIEYLGYNKMSESKGADKGKHTLPFSKVMICDVYKYACEHSDVLCALGGILAERLKEEGVDELFHTIEMPLVPVLAEIERNGVLIDMVLLRHMSKEFDEKLVELEGTIYHLSGEEFNINSQKQLSIILFEKLGMPKLRKTKTGYSTDAEVLVKLSEEFELPRLILGYRNLKKLKSTYIDALPRMVSEKTGRIHASFNQTVTSTGRLSSSDPNLQNIPIRGKEGKRIRSAFIAPEGRIIVSADYSQIELRVLAHIANDEKLIHSFLHDEDIHTTTASEIFDVLPCEVTEDMRRQAKVVNFGVIYGMSPFGLASELGVSRKEAEHYIESYFAKHSGVKDYIEKTIEKTINDGFVMTLFGRKRYIPEIQSKDMNRRQFGERAAINLPIQGTAAEIMKIAMIRVSKAIKERKLSCKIIIQVHDELVVEVDTTCVDLAMGIIKKEMEEVVHLAVPLKVTISHGNNWGETH